MPTSALLSFLLLCITITPPTRATGGLSAGERSKLVDYLKYSRQLLESETAKLTPQQWTHKPAADRWSVADCVEHLALAEEVIRGVVDRALKAPAVEPADAQTVTERDQLILRLATDRGQKFNAPERLRPAGLTPAEAMKKFLDSRAVTVEFARTTQEDLRGHAADHPLFKNADVYQWLLLAASHVERHVNQIRELKADPSFPK